MSEADLQEQKLLETRLGQALEEALAKTSHAFEETKNHAEGFAKKIGLAAEAADYSSLLYSLTYGLEDKDPPPPDTKGLDLLTMVRESMAALQQVRSGNKKEYVDAYALLRSATHRLRTAYLNSLKETKRPR